MDKCIREIHHSLPYLSLAITIYIYIYIYIYIWYKKVLVAGVLKNYEVCNWLFLLVSIQFLSFLFVCLLKLQWKEWQKERQRYFSTQFLFSWFTTFWVEEFVLEPVEIAVLLGQAVRRTSIIILTNCESLVSSLRGLRISHVWVW